MSMVLLCSMQTEASWIQRLGSIAQSYKKNICDYWRSYRLDRTVVNNHLIDFIQERTTKSRAFLDSIPSNCYKIDQKELLDRILTSLHEKKPYDAQTYAYLMRFLNKETNNQLFEILKRGKTLNLDPRIVMRPRYNYKQKLRQHYKLRDEAQRALQQPWTYGDTIAFNNELKRAWLAQLAQRPYQTVLTSRILDDAHVDQAAQENHQQLEQQCLHDWIKHKEQLADYAQQRIDDVEAYNTVFGLALDRKFYGANRTSPSRVMEAD